MLFTSANNKTKFVIAVVVTKMPAFLAEALHMISFGINAVKS